MRGGRRAGLDWENITTGKISWDVAPDTHGRDNLAKRLLTKRTIARVSLVSIREHNQQTTHDTPRESARVAT